MKYGVFWLFTIFIFGFTAAQPAADKSYHFIYLSSWTYEKGDPIPNQEWVSLSVKGDSSIYQKYNKRKLDSITSFRQPTPEEMSSLFNIERYAIEFAGEDVTFYDMIGNRLLKYKETLSHNWKLINESKTIKGYACKKATVTYGGRDWIAWYAPEVPFSVGPYKFRGLPGLIIKATDSTGDFDFELNKFREKKYLKLTKYVHSKPVEEMEVITRKDYNKLRLKWSILSTDERLAMMNNGDAVTFAFTSFSGEPMDMNTTRKRANEIGFIEMNHD